MLLNQLPMPHNQPLMLLSPQQPNLFTHNPHLLIHPISSLLHQ